MDFEITMAFQNPCLKLHVFSKFEIFADAIAVLSQMKPVGSNCARQMSFRFVYDRHLRTASFALNVSLFSGIQRRVEISYWLKKFMRMIVSRTPHSIHPS
jgi:hypothetical protein